MVLEVTGEAEGGVGDLLQAPLEPLVGDSCALAGRGHPWELRA